MSQEDEFDEKDNFDDDLEEDDDEEQEEPEDMEDMEDMEDESLATLEVDEEENIPINEYKSKFSNEMR